MRCAARQSIRLLAAALFALPLFAQTKPDAAALVKAALGEGMVPYAAVKPVTVDFKGDGHPALAVVVDFNRKLAAWLKRGVVILNLDSPALAPMRPDNEQHFCFGLLVFEDMQAARKTVFYGCFTGWRVVRGAKAALDLDMDAGSVLRLYYDGTRYRTRTVRGR